MPIVLGVSWGSECLLGEVPLYALSGVRFLVLKDGMLFWGLGLRVETGLNGGGVTKAFKPLVIAINHR